MSTIEIDHGTLTAYHGAACTRCAGRTRLIGIEPHSTKVRTDLHTYQCMACDAVQTRVVPLAS